ncbi:MAG: hypothetical protein QME66_04355 [Candidatus Eisenbacteria bacterium]|nr:hypothetical protein [Candidatus Eisenbacteria bacterium]
MPRDPKIKNEYFPEVDPIDPTFLADNRQRVSEIDVIPQQVTDRLLATGAVVAHTLSGAAHTGGLSAAQHGSLGAIASAHAFSDLSGSIASSQIPTAHKRRLSVYVKASADAAAGTATAEIPVFQAVDAVTITGTFFLPGAALIADNTNYATLLCYRRSTTGGTQTTIASRTTQITGSGNWTAFDGVTLGTLSVTAVAAGEMVSFEITKTAGGVVVPTGVFQIEYTID